MLALCISEQKIFIFIENVTNSSTAQNDIFNYANFIELKTVLGMDISIYLS